MFTSPIVCLVGYHYKHIYCHKPGLSTQLLVNIVIVTLFIVETISSLQRTRLHAARRLEWCVLSWWIDGLFDKGQTTTFTTECNKCGTNPFSEEYTAHVPEGEWLSFDGQAGGTFLDFAEMEQLGLECMEHVAVVLVAGGLGERLGYSGIKLSLECNLCSNKSYLEYYIC
jgi:hypothetical protein